MQKNHIKARLNCIRGVKQLCVSRFLLADRITNIYLQEADVSQNIGPANFSVQLFLKHF